MAEGPQVLIRTQWLSRWLVGRVASLKASRPYLVDGCSDYSGRTVEAVTCHGKHIFLRFGDDAVLHNHLLMKGRWKKYPGGMLFPPDDAWITIDVGETTICNLHGQMLEWVGDAEARSIVDSLGPDAMAKPYPRDRIDAALRRSALAISEALLDQSLVAGIGNIAKSEILFTARVDPGRMSAELSAEERDRLHERIKAILWESYENGGRWIHRVYMKMNEPCPACGSRIERMHLAPSRRSTYFCPRCQVRSLPTLF